MKTAITILLCVGMTSLISAKSNQSIMFPTGTEYMVKKIQLNKSNFNPGEPGINKVWIMDNLSGISMNINVEKASESLYFNDFPTADIVIENDYVGTSAHSFGHVFYHFYKSSNGSLLKLGRVDIDTITGEEHINVFSNTENKMNDFLIYSFKSTDYWEGFYEDPVQKSNVFWSVGNTSYHIDSKGKLVVNGYNLENVYRIKRERSFTESSSFMKSKNYKTISYEWWVDDVPIPIVYLEHIVSDGTSPDEYFAYYVDKSHYLLVGEEEIENRLTEINIFPNPMNDFVNFSFYLNEEGMVKISLLDLSGRIVSNLLEERKLSGSHRVTSTLEVSPGIYMVKFDFGGRSVVKRLAIN